MDGDNATLGQTISDYASQVVDLNAKIKALPKGDDGLLPGDKNAYSRLKQQRDAITDKVSGLSAKAKKAGAEAPDFAAEIKKVGTAPKADAATAEDKPAADPAPQSKIAEMRARPGGEAYADLSDQELADKMYQKFYSDLPREQFDAKIGLKPEAAAAEPEQKMPIGGFEGDPSLSAHDVGQGIRGAVSGVLGIPGDIESLGLAGLKKLGLAGKGEDTFFPSSKDVEEGLFDKPDNKRDEGYRELGGIVGGAATPGSVLGAGKGLASAGRVGKDVLGTLRGTEGKAALKAIREETGGRVAEAAGQKAAAAQTAEQKAAAIKATQDDLRTKQPQVAGQRAEQRAVEPAPGEPPVGLERKSALTRLQGDVQGSEKELQQARSATDETTKGAAGTTTDQEAQSAAAKLDEYLLSKPGASKEEFGGTLEKAIRDTNTKYDDIRKRESGYGKALADAGDDLRVETGHISARIDDIIKREIRNPTTRRQLETLKKELGNVVDDGDKETVHEALSVTQADSLRKTINEAIAKEMYDGDAVSAEARNKLTEVGKMLTKEATEAWEPYKTALGKYATLSRPLEFINKNPLLRKVTVSNPEATEAVVTRSQIVGKLLTDANKQDRKALARLVQESPEIRDSARLYFTQDLFGPAGLRDLKSVQQMRSWLIKNKPALDQLGIFQEFKDIATARATAQRALDNAAGVAKQGQKQIAEATAREKEIQQRLKAQQALRDRAQGRVGEASSARTKALEEQQAAATKRAGEADKRLGKSAETATKTAEQEKAAAQTYKNLGEDLRLASNKDLPSTAKSAIVKLRDAGTLSPKDYETMRSQIDDAVKSISDTKTLRKRVVAIIGAGILLQQLGYGTYRSFMTAVGG